MFKAVLVNNRVHIYRELPVVEWVMAQPKVNKNAPAIIAVVRDATRPRPHDFDFDRFPSALF